MICCEFENGGKAELRHAVADGVVYDASSNSVLLVRRAERLVEGGKWAITGGYLDRDETVKQAVVREVLEETGYDASIVELMQIVSNPNRRGDDRQNVGFVFLLAPGELIGSPDDESSEIGWFKLDALPEDLAFDHFETLELLRAHLAEPKALPVLS